MALFFFSSIRQPLLSVQSFLTNSSKIVDGDVEWIESGRRALGTPDVTKD